jgi:hypothetical protein
MLAADALRPGASAAPTLQGGASPRGCFFALDEEAGREDKRYRAVLALVVFNAREREFRRLAFAQNEPSLWLRGRHASFSGWPSTGPESSRPGPE